MKKEQTYSLNTDGITMLKDSDKASYCPYYTTKEILNENRYKDYNEATQKVIDLIATKQHLDPVGSSKFLVHKYPSDIDLLEPVEGCCTINKVRFKLARDIQDIIRRLQNHKDIFFSRFQCGYDSRYKIYWGTERNGKVIDFSTYIARREIHNLRRQELITDEEYTKGLKLVKNNPTIDEYLSLYWFFFKMGQLNWKEEEILQGYKERRGNKRIYLDDCLIDGNLVKLDVWAQLPYPDMEGSRYVEMTNWFVVQVKDEEGNVQTLSLIQEDRIKSLRSDVYKHTSEKFFDPLKATKRYWNYLFELEQTDDVIYEMKKLAPLFSSYVSFLNSVATDLELQERMYRIGLVNKTYYKKFLNDTKTRLLNYPPKCYFDPKVNSYLLLLLGKLEVDKAVKEISNTIDRLTLKYLEDNDIDMIAYVEQ